MFGMLGCGFSWLILLTYVLIAGLLIKDDQNYKKLRKKKNRACRHGYGLSMGRGDGVGQGEERFLVRIQNGSFLPQQATQCTGPRQTTWNDGSKNLISVPIFGYSGWVAPHSRQKPPSLKPLSLPAYWLLSSKGDYGFIFMHLDIRWVEKTLRES